MGNINVPFGGELRRLVHRLILVASRFHPGPTDCQEFLLIRSPRISQALRCELLPLRASQAEATLLKAQEGLAAAQGDADALDDGELVVSLASLRVREASTRASGRARADEAATDGDPGWTREALTESSLVTPTGPPK